MTLSTVITASIFVIAIVSFSPIDVSAEYDHFLIPEISGSIAVSEYSQDYSDEAKIALSVAMAVSENSVENGKAMWGKLDVVQGFLVYKIGVLASDDIFHVVVVDGGNGVLYVLDGVSKNNWKHSKHSDNESHKK